MDVWYASLLVMLWLDFSTRLFLIFFNNTILTLRRVVKKKTILLFSLES